MKEKTQNSAYEVKKNCLRRTERKHAKGKAEVFCVFNEACITRTNIRRFEVLVRWL